MPIATPRRVPTDASISDLTTDGTWISWSAGEGITAPDIYRWRPGDAAPQLVWRNPERVAAIDQLVAHGDHYAFVDAGEEVNDTITWRFWYLDAPGEQAARLASVTRPVDKRGIVALPALSDRYLVYTIPRYDGDAVTSELVAMDLRTRAARVVARSDFRDTEYWYPALDGSRLVYGTVEYRNDALHGERHVYLLDLDVPDATPRRLDSKGEASQPDILGDSVVWKTAAFNYNANNWGQIVEHSLLDGSETTLELGPADGWVQPDIGPRFATAEPDEWSYLGAWDRQTGAQVTIDSADPRSGSGFMHPALAGSLMVYVAAPDYTGVGGEI
ncbi:MAG TPA: hypothetical protein VFM74_03815, partial [Candidatus Limnocylindria bacterium]|nr:hypothetical protein [Candidatus Limnocylindria bacterium]